MIAKLSNVDLSWPLKIVAYLFILGGFFTIFYIAAVEFLLGHMIFSLYPLCVVVGRGLLRYNPRSLKWAMFFTWVGLIFAPIAAVLALAAPGKFMLFGVYAGLVPPVLSALACVLLFVMYCWQYRVLTDSRIRRLFE